MLRYWSVRYFVILFASMGIMGVITVYVIQLTIDGDQRRSMMRMTAEIAAGIELSGGRIPVGGGEMQRWMDSLVHKYDIRNKRVVVFVWDSQGEMTQHFPPALPDVEAGLAEWRERILSGEARVFRLPAANAPETFIAAVHPVGQGDGYALLLLPEVNLVRSFADFKFHLLILACMIALTGWGVIYVLTRRLARPIREASEAAKQVVAGNYKLEPGQTPKEKEIYELTRSFREMADRLHWLETLRTQLLAGVTHELKTPVASISGLLQAMKDGVVSGEERDRFLEVCLADSKRLQKMVGDLLEFNRFAGNAVAVVKETRDLPALVGEIAERWRDGQREADVRVEVETASDAADWRTRTDPGRVEQILVNLLNNARDAMEGGVIAIRLLADSSRYRIQVRDTGHGIPREEQLDIFEPFYRGRQKQSKVRGLGIGLPFSRLIARSLGGDLVLTDSSPAGSTFTLLLPFDEK